MTLTLHRAGTKSAEVLPDAGVTATTAEAVDGGGFVNTVAASADGTLLVAGADLGGIWTSRTGGVGWAAANRALFDKAYTQVASVLVDPDDPSVVYAAVGIQSPSAFFKSTNGGLTWTRTSTAIRVHAGNNKTVPLPGTHPRSVGNLIAKIGSTLFVACYIGTAGGTNYGVMRSTDGGATWSSIGVQGAGQYLRGIATDGANLFVAVYNDGVYLCSDPTGGSPTFTKMTGANAPTHPEEFLVMGGQLYCAADHQGVRRVPTAGVAAATAWVDITGSLARGAAATGASGLPVGTVAPDSASPAPDGPYWCSLAGRVDGAGHHIVYAGCARPEHVTANPNNTYRAVWVNADATAATVWSCLTDTPAGVGFTHGGPTGASWWLYPGQPANLLGGGSYVASQMVLIGTTLFVCGRSGLWRYTEAADGAGIHWYPISRQLGLTVNRDVAADPHGANVWIGNTDWVILHSADRLASVAQESPSPNTGYCLALDTQLTPARVYAGIGQRDTNTGGQLFSKLPGDAAWTDEQLFTGALGVSDTFTRTVASGWGTADVGGVWTVPNNSTEFSVNGAAGIVAAPASAARTYIATLAANNMGNPAGSVVVSWSAAPAGVAAANHKISKTARVSGSTMYIGRITQTAAAGNPTTLEIATLVTGTEVVKASLAIPTPSVGQRYVLELDLAPGIVDPVGATLVTVSFYPEGDPDSAATVVFEDNTAALQGLSGGNGLRIIRSSTNTAACTYTVDTFSAVDAGSVSGKRPLGVAVGRDGSNNVVMVAAVEQGGLRRRVGAGAFADIAFGPGTKPMDPATAQATKSAPMVWPGGQYLYLFDRQTGVWRSGDYGATWTLILPTSELAGFQVVDLTGYIAADPTTPGRVYVAWNLGMLRLDGAHTGTALPGGSIVRTDLAVTGPGPVECDTTGRVYVATAPSLGVTAKLLRSANAGASWIDITTTAERDTATRASAIAVTDQGAVVVATVGQGVITRSAG